MANSEKEIKQPCVIHTLSINNLRHTYYSHNTPQDYYTNLYYGDLTSVKDRTKSLSVRNTIGLSLREGFNKWALWALP